MKLCNKKKFLEMTAIKNTYKSMKHIFVIKVLWVNRKLCLKQNRRPLLSKKYQHVRSVETWTFALCFWSESRLKSFCIQNVYSC